MIERGSRCPPLVGDGKRNYGIYGVRVESAVQRVSIPGVRSALRGGGGIGRRSRFGSGWVAPFAGSNPARRIQLTLLVYRKRRVCRIPTFVSVIVLGGLSPRLTARDWDVEER
jgi:hypothetical protein